MCGKPNFESSDWLIERLLADFTEATTGKCRTIEDHIAPMHETADDLPVARISYIRLGKATSAVAS